MPPNTNTLCPDGACPLESGAHDSACIYADGPALMQRIHEGITALLARGEHCPCRASHTVRHVEAELHAVMIAEATMRVRPAQAEQTWMDETSVGGATAPIPQTGYFVDPETGVVL